MWGQMESKGCTVCLLTWKETSLCSWSLSLCICETASSALTRSLCSVCTFHSRDCMREHITKFKPGWVHRYPARPLNPDGAPRTREGGHTHTHNAVATLLVLWHAQKLLVILGHCQNSSTRELLYSLSAFLTWYIFLLLLLLFSPPVYSSCGSSSLYNIQSATAHIIKLRKGQ